MTPTQFRSRIRQSISDEALQIALDNNAERRLKGRVAAFASLPDWRERRQRAHAVRAEIVQHLDEYLAQFIQRAEQNGVVVHRAADAAEANRLVLQIVGAGRKLIAKSKSMISEEIDLNRALETAGDRVVETDLGEYIVQLRGEKPAHIITPAVHLRRHQVGQLFQEKLGIPYTEDIPTLTQTARKVLREVFLTAEVGISGVNFGVVETGTLCIVTNEGNGRMVTTMPPTHIALMGMERMVPTLDDLALMLSLLPRSATGQKLSVYTQLLHSPRRAGELDGARQRHLIILDNGRSRMQQSGLQEALYCIRCGACLNACPVFRELSGHAYVGADGSLAPYPGPIGSVVSPGLLDLQQFGHLAQASSLCGACKDACPVDIDLPKLLTRVRAGNPSNTTSNEKRAGVGLSLLSRVGLKAYGRIAASPRLFNISQKLAGFGTRILSPFSQWMWIPAFTGWGTSKDFPRFATRTFREKFHYEAARSTSVRKSDNTEEKKVNASPLPDTDLVERFSHELELVGGHAHLLAMDQLPPSLVEFLKENYIHETMMWDAVPALTAVDLINADIRVEKGVESKARAGITGALSAIADTGTLVIPSAAGQPLSASLLGEFHIAVVKASQILPSLEDALKNEEVRKASAVALITGPSRTADIEMTLTIGVHGPKELHVFILQADPSFQETHEE